VINQSTTVFFYNKASLFYTRNATHLKCQNLDIHAYANIFCLTLQYVCLQHGEILYCVKYECGV